MNIWSKEKKIIEKTCHNVLLNFYSRIEIHSIKGKKIFIFIG